MTQKNRRGYFAASVAVAVLAIVLSAAAVPLFGDSDAAAGMDIVDDGRFVYQLQEMGDGRNEAQIISFNPDEFPDGQIIFPSAVENEGLTYEVNQIYNQDTSRAGFSQFEGSAAIKAVHIPSTVKILARETFRNCVNLESVTFGTGSSLNTLSSYAFFGTGVGELDLSDTKLTSLDYVANSRSFERIVLPSTLEYLGGTDASYNAYPVFCGVKPKVIDLTLSTNLTNVYDFIFSDYVDGSGSRSPVPDTAVTFDGNSLSSTSEENTFIGGHCWYLGSDGNYYSHQTVFIYDNYRFEITDAVNREVRLIGYDSTIQFNSISLPDKAMGPDSIEYIVTQVGPMVSYGDYKPFGSCDSLLYVEMGSMQSMTSIESDAFSGTSSMDVIMFDAESLKAVGDQCFVKLPRLDFRSSVNLDSAGVFTSEHGAVTFDGRDLSGLPPSERAGFLAGELWVPNDEGTGYIRYVEPVPEPEVPESEPEIPPFILDPNWDRPDTPVIVPPTPVVPVTSGSSDATGEAAVMIGAAAAAVAALCALFVLKRD